MGCNVPFEDCAPLDPNRWWTELDPEWEPEDELLREDMDEQREEDFLLPRPKGRGDGGDEGGVQWTLPLIACKSDMTWKYVKN